MATKKNAPTRHKHTEPVPATIEDLIVGARENIDHQMQQDVFKHLSRNYHLQMARQSIMQAVLLDPSLTDMSQKELEKYLTEELEINDKLPKK